MAWCGKCSVTRTVSIVKFHSAGKGFSSLFKGKTIDKLEDCFHAFTEDEKLDGNEAFWCSVCEARTTATKVLRIHRFPRALVLHIKRFKVQPVHKSIVWDDGCYIAFGSNRKRALTWLT